MQYLTPDDRSAIRARFPILTMREIAAEVAEEYGVSAEEILSKDRKDPLAEARQVVMFIMHERCGCSYSLIARIMGLDHTTIRHGVCAEKRRRGIR